MVDGRSRRVFLSEILTSEASWVNFCLRMWRDFEAELVAVNTRFDVRGWPFHNFRLEMCAAADSGLLQYAMFEGPEAYPHDTRLPNVTNDIGLGAAIAAGELSRLQDSGYSVTVDDDGIFTNISLSNFEPAVYV